MPQLYLSDAKESIPDTRTCDCFAHKYANAADSPSGGHCYPTDMRDAEWAAVPRHDPEAGVGRGPRRRPEEYCHRDILDTVMVTPASTGDRDAAQDLLSQAARRHHRLRRVWADSGYTGMLVGWCAKALNLTLTIIRRSDGQTGFVVLTAVRDWRDAEDQATRAAAGGGAR